jgi:hypothetical protein
MKKGLPLLEIASKIVRIPKMGDKTTNPINATEWSKIGLMMVGYILYYFTDTIRW